MHLYVDESGDTGLTGKPGSSSHFVVVAVVFENDNSAIECRRTVRALRDRLGWRSRQEFKFNKTRSDFRRVFFEAVANCEFWFAGVVVAKTRLLSRRGETGEDLHRRAVALLFDSIAARLINATVVMDQCGSAAFRESV